MPVLDNKGNVIGTIHREDPSTGNYSLCFVTVCFQRQLMKLYPAEAEGEEDLSKFSPIGEIKCQYITKVGTTSTRPKALNSFEIVTTGVVHHFGADSVEERDEWIETIKQSSMRQGSFKNATSKSKEQSKDVGYKTQIVGGVIRRIPIQGEGSDDSERSDLTSSGPASIGGVTASEDGTTHGGGGGKPPTRIVKAGYATKCGAVMKSWKRRFFIVSEQSFGYYKSIEETEPIRSFLVSDLTSVGKSKVHAGKEHLLEVGTPQRIFYIQADTEEEMGEWIKAFQTVITAKRTSQTLPVTAKERCNSLSNTLDSARETDTPDTPDIQEYDSSPQLSVSKDKESLQEKQLANGDEKEDSDDFSIGTKV